MFGLEKAQGRPDPCNKLKGGYSEVGVGHFNQVVSDRWRSGSICTREGLNWILEKFP